MTVVTIAKRLALAAIIIASAACGGEEHKPMSERTTATSDSPPPHSAQRLVDALARSLTVEYQVIANKTGGCGAGGSVYPADGPCYEGRLSLTAGENIQGAGWAIYFSQTEPVALVAPGEFAIEHVNGDLHRLSPSESFAGFGAGETKMIDFVVRGQVLTEAKLLPNYFAASEGATPKVIESTRLHVDPDTGLPARPYIAAFSRSESLFRKGPNDTTPLATAAFLFDANKNVQSVGPEVIDRAIVPTPKSVTIGDSGVRLDISEGVAISLDGVALEDVAAPLARLQTLGVGRSEGGVPLLIRLVGDESRIAESYSLDIGADRISIEARDPAGAAYGLYSLASLLSPGRADLPLMKVEDEPRFQFRGMHVDVARNFHSKGAILKLLDQMAAYKLNKLHLHLADDEGWRLEIPGLPELTDIGARRCFDPEERNCLMMQLGSGPTGEAPVDGYFSVADYTEILQAATARHIQVIPSLDMPGHARAAVKAMEARYRRFMERGQPEQAREFLLSDPDDATRYESIQYYNDNTINVCMESSYAFVGKIIDEMKEIHAKAGQPLTRYHIGADETAGAWKDSPACKAFLAGGANGVDTPEKLGAYFLERVANILAAKDVEPAGWNDGLGHTDPKKMPAHVQSNAWGVLAWGGAAAAHEQANRGWEVVVSIPDALYFDFPYEADPKEGGYYWGARRVNTRKVFELMPENLPAHAEFWKDSNEQPFAIDDRSAPLKKGARFAGMQGQVWSETILTDDMLEYMVFPRLLALAERAWRRAEWEVPYDYRGALYDSGSGRFTAEMRAERDEDWARFAATLARKELLKLDRTGVFYRIPTVGARIENGVLEANTIFPGLPIEYREGDGEWKRYEGPTPVSGQTSVRARSADGARPGRAICVDC